VKRDQHRRIDPRCFREIWKQRALSRNLGAGLYEPIR
jgi:hypothetical protein